MEENDSSDFGKLNIEDTNSSEIDAEVSALQEAWRIIAILAKRLRYLESLESSKSLPQSDSSQSNDNKVYIV